MKKKKNDTLAVWSGYGEDRSRREVRSFHARDRRIINTHVLHPEDVLSVRELASHRSLMLTRNIRCRLTSLLFNPPRPSLLTLTIVAPMGSNDQMGWLPGLGTRTRSRRQTFADLEFIRDIKTIDPSVDEVQFSIVCEGCGKHFWSRSKAKSHAALTTHILHEDTLPDSPVPILESPAASPASTHTLAEASRDMNPAEQERTEDSGDDEHGSYFDCGEILGYYEAANKHANIECKQDTPFVPSSAPNGSLTSAMPSAAAACDNPATDSSIHPNSPSWNASRVRLPNTTITDAGSSTSHVNKERAISTIAHGISSERSGRVIDPFPKQSQPPFASNVSQ